MTSAEVITQPGYDFSREQGADPATTEAEDDWGGLGMLLGVDFDAKRGQIEVLAATGSLRASVEKVHVEAEVTPNVDHYIRRRIGRFPEFLNRIDRTIVFRP